MEIYAENDKVILRPLVEEDLPALVRLVNDPLVYRYEPDFLEERQGTPEEALQRIRQMDLERDRHCILGICEKDRPGEMIGLMEFYDYKPSGKVICLGDRLRSDMWGRGLGSSCIRAAIEIIQTYTKAELVTGHILPVNLGSVKTAARNGFEYLLTKEESWGKDKNLKTEVFILDIVR